MYWVGLSRFKSITSQNSSQSHPIHSNTHVISITEQALKWIKWVQIHNKSKFSLNTFTTGIRGFAECCILCRVPFVGHSAKKALSSAALGKVRLSAKSP